MVKRKKVFFTHIDLQNGFQKYNQYVRTHAQIDVAFEFYNFSHYTSDGNEYV
jgi:hypothetical protein